MGSDPDDAELIARSLNGDMDAFVEVVRRHEVAVGAYLARMLLVGGMFSMFFFLSQYLQGVRGFSPLETGIAFLPMTAVMFSMVRFVPRMAARWGDNRLLLGGVTVALAGMAGLSRIGETTPYSGCSSAR